MTERLTDEQLRAWRDKLGGRSVDVVTELLELRARVEELKEELQRIVRWGEAYPLDVFPEPDLKRARELLEAGGMTLDAVSASAMRCVVTGVSKIARAALKDALQ
jgi:hypothetical protein